MPWARRHVVDMLRRWRVPSERIDTAELLVSELTTNAVHHPRLDPDRSVYSPQTEIRTVTVTLQLSGDRLSLLVHDFDRRPPVLKEVGLDAENGRGVFLVACMSSRWGHYLPALGGKVVWCELSLTEATTATAPADEPGDRQQAAPLLMARTLVGLRRL